MGSSGILTIEWDMMDKTRFFSFTMLNSFMLRTAIYPFTVIKTRLQIQKHNVLYKGTFDAFVKILRYEGFGSLYRGFWINSIQIVSGIGYMISYEKMRHLLTKYGNVHDGRIKGLIGGAIGSLVGQTIITPFDVISQHMMVMGQRGSKTESCVVNSLNLQYDPRRRAKLAPDIIRELYKRDGFRGFYRGYFASVYAYVPGGALWWMLYPFYSDLLVKLLPPYTSHIFIQCVSGPLSGITVCLVTNPLDIVRARIQWTPG